MGSIYNKNTTDLLSYLDEQNIKTWFDLGIFIDRFKENLPKTSVKNYNDYSSFSEHIQNSGIAYITFLYSIDGVTVEVEKYTKVMEEIFPKIPVHYIAGKIYPEARKILNKNHQHFEVKEISGFNAWDLYHSFFFKNMERGSLAYNQLILDFWNEVLIIIKKLGTYFEKNQIGLIHAINVFSNPGNVSLSLALVLITEYFGIPVISNNHDYYWEGGNREIDRLEKGLKKGPRDFFFNNAHLGEVFSLIEILFPWESKNYLTVNINNGQTRHVIEKNGHNPANLSEIGTAVDTREYSNISKRDKINAYYQFEKILSRYQDTLVCYSASDVIKNGLVEKNNPKPILIGCKTRSIQSFLAENVLFIQPTRIISRKRIEIGFKLIKKLFDNNHFLEKLKATPNLKVTIMVTGPIAQGHFEYFEKLINRFSRMINSLDEEFRSRIYLAFIFSELDQDNFRKRFKNPVDIPQLYSISSLVLLPSKTEGRGLPIIEAAACGTPIFCRRYFPKQVYSEVIGEHLPESDRLRVIEFDGKKVSSKHVKQILQHVLFPHKYSDDVMHNKRVVNKRYSLISLKKNIEEIMLQLFYQTTPQYQGVEYAKESFNEYAHFFHYNKDFEFLLPGPGRYYLPGYGKLAYMHKLKSLIDPSYFRVEEQEIRGYVFMFAKTLVEKASRYQELDSRKVTLFYNAIYQLFTVTGEDYKIQHDHSFAYRHRNRNYYLYQDYTLQELTGIVNLLCFKIINPGKRKTIDENSHFFTDWNLALSQLTSSVNLAIDDRNILIMKLQLNIPLAIFPGDHLKYILEFFALQSVRSRLRLPLHEELTSEIVNKHKNELEPVYVFAQKIGIGSWLNVEELIDFIVNGPEQELKLLYQFNIIRIIESQQLTVGIHIAQIGEEGLKVLGQVKKQNGCVITNRAYASIMTDNIDLDRFHIGKVQDDYEANFMGIPSDSGFIQYVPAGIRSTIGYPTPVQDAVGLNRCIKGELFQRLSNRYGMNELVRRIRTYMQDGEKPVDHILQEMIKEPEEEQEVVYNAVGGIYPDNRPWNGVFAKVNRVENKEAWEFIALKSENHPKTVIDFVNDFQSEKRIEVEVAWNGGYILNPELVGKLGIGEEYIGSPLGLIAVNSEMISAPLFNKPALIIDKNKSLKIERVNCLKGVNVSRGTLNFRFLRENLNVDNSENVLNFYDLMYEKEGFFGLGKILVRLSGNVVKEVRKTDKNEFVPIIPVGLTLSIPQELYENDPIQRGDVVHFSVPGLNNVLHAIEAGPLLVKNGRVAIDMKTEGWGKKFSIQTQAARLDYEDMRGPKIAVGIDFQDNLYVLAINGRIRESVGATNQDMANILVSHGIREAMGFDPGGSSTLVVNGKTVNISPYNKNYENNVFALPPQPRAVSNVVLGYRNNKK